MIAIIDYGLGNIKAFVNLYDRLNVGIRIVKIPKDLENVSKLILPGVGAFDHAMNLLDKSGMRTALETLVFKNKLPILGICVGMQILAESSEEGSLNGLGWIPGKVKKLGVRSKEVEKDKSSKTQGKRAENLITNHEPRTTNHELSLPLPHMGWNCVKTKIQDTIFKDLEENARFYFLHSYYFECKEEKHSAATAFYGTDFTCAVKKDNIYGVQFHPEKSHHNGIKVLKNFAEM